MYHYKFLLCIRPSLKKYLLVAFSLHRSVLFRLTLIYFCNNRIYVAKNVGDMTVYLVNKNSG